MTMPAQPITAREIVTNLDVGPLQHRIIMRAFRGILSSAKGVLVMRGYTVPPHSHPTDENVTVLSGTFHFAMGDKLDKTKGETVSAGGFFRAEQGMHHYAWASSPVVIQIHGIGPFAITYVNPADDPRNKPSAQTAPSTSGSTTK
jgi:Cupin domain